MIFIYTNEIINIEIIKKLFNWCWSKGMINAVALYKDSTNLDQIFGYDFFPEIILQNQTNNFNSKIWFPKKLNNFKRYPLKTPIFHDPPRAFVYNNTKDGDKVFGGHVVKLLQNFANKHNIQLQKTNIGDSKSSVSYETCFTLIDRKEIDLCLHPYMITIKNGTTFSYPLSKLDICVMVRSKPIPISGYIILPFEKEVWYAISFAVFYLSIIWSITVFTITGKYNYGNAFSNTILGISYQACSERIFHRSFRSLFTFGQVYFLGLILSNIYLALLTSFWSETIFEKQMDTIEDIVEAKIQIMMNSFDIDRKLNHSDFPIEFKRLCIPSDGNTYSEHRDSLNLSYGYLVPSDKYLYLLEKQKYLDYPLFYITSTCFEKSFLTFPIQIDSIFLDLLNRYILEVQQSGLHIKWENQALYELKTGDIEHLRKRTKYSKYHQLKVKHLYLALIFLGSGFCISSICFLIENFVSSMKSLLKKLF